MGFGNAASFRASGNVVFDAPRKPSEARIEEGLENALGYEVAAFLRRPTEMAEMGAMASIEPFEPGARFHVMFLKRLPAPGNQRDVLTLSTDDDKLAFGKRE